MNEDIKRLNGSNQHFDIRYLQGINIRIKP